MAPEEHSDILEVLFLNVRMCVRMSSVCAPHVCRCLPRLDEGIGLPGAGVTSGHKPRSVGAGN